MYKIIFALCAFLSINLDANVGVITIRNPNANCRTWDQEPMVNKIIIFKYDSNYSQSFYIMTTYKKQNLETLKKLSPLWNDIGMIKDLGPCDSCYFIHHARISVDTLKDLDFLFSDVLAD